jgi:hypothetical protein
MKQLLDNKFHKQEDKFIAWVEIDYVPLYDVVGLFSDGSKLIPTDKEFLETIDFLDYLLSKYGDRIKYYIGPGVKLIKKNPKEFLIWLKEIWHLGKYRKVDRSVWFDLEFTKSELVYFAKEVEQSYKIGRAYPLDREQLLSLVEQAKKLGVEVRIDKGHPSTFWNMEHLNIGPNGYHIPILSE